MDGKATNATVEIDLKENKLPPGTYTFYLQTQTAGKYRNNPEAAKTAEDELKQSEMRERLGEDRIRYFVGDVRDKGRLIRAAMGADVLIHAAAGGMSVPANTR